ncbi:MAG: hypothetical protein N2663_09155, partial [Chlorobi bacterium]|nr:hypothetical protein [Chlorobiota bacterium]
QQQLGSGSLWITANGKRVWTLDGDCGKGEIFDFRVGPVPQLNIQRDTIDFGATPVGMPVWRKRTIRPGTAAALQITHLQVSSFPANTGFRLVQTEPPLPPGGLWLRSSDSLVLTLEYSPPQEETRIRTATLTIVSNDYNEPNLRLLLRGTTPNVLEVAAPQMPMEWSVVPLPASDRVRIHTSISPTECWLVTLDGRAVHTPFIVDRTTVEIDCTSLSGGVYGAVVETVAGRVMVPIVVVR